MVQIDDMRLFGRAWELIRRNKQLWALGFVAALSGDLLSNIRIGPELNLASSGPLLSAGVFDIRTWGRALGLLGGNLVVASVVTALVAVVVLAAVLCARAALAGATRSLTHGEPFDLATALQNAAHILGSLVQVTVLLYGPYLLVSDVAGEILRLLPGLFRLPIYLVLLVLLAVSIVLPFVHVLAICRIALDGCPPKPAIARSWRMLQQNWRRWVVLLGLQLICSGLAQLVLRPVAGVSLLSLALTSLRNGYPDPWQTLGLVVLGIVSTAIAAPAQVFGMVTLTLVHQESAGGVK